MKKVLVLQHGDLGACDWSAFGGLVSAPLGKLVLRLPVDDDFELTDEMRAALIAQQIDGAVLPDVAFADLGLIVSDMDSTLITIECVDEIAAGVGLKDEVAAITEQSMRGELDFEQSLRKRVALLAGLDVIGSHLTEVNVTSPTGFQEITKQKGFDVAAKFIDAVERNA